jgi:outer membrane lipoprotein-sorting protein
MRRILWVVALFAMAAALSSCAKPPQVEFDSANAKLEEARQAEAEKYAPADYSAARDTLSAAQREMETQKGKFALLRKYSRSRELIASAESQAVATKQAAIEGKQRTMKEADALILQAQAAIDSANVLVGKAPKGKETRADLELIKSDLQGAQTSLEDAKASFQREEYLEAKAKAEAVVNRTGTLIAEVNAAIEKYAAARGGHR